MEKCAGDGTDERIDLWTSSLDWTAYNQANMGGERRNGYLRVQTWGIEKDKSQVNNVEISEVDGLSDSCWHGMQEAVRAYGFELTDIGPEFK